MGEFNYFEQRGYAVIPNLLPPVVCEIISNAMRIEAATKTQSDVVNIPSHDFYGTPYGDSLLLSVQRIIEPAINDLIPTYSFGRIYKKGSILRMHTDRDQCEVSVSVCLDYIGDQSWPFVVVTNQGEVEEVCIGVGDAIIYQGNKVAHGRDCILENDESVHMFLHYVKKNGDHSNLKYDGRKTLGAEKTDV